MRELVLFPVQRQPLVFRCCHVLAYVSFIRVTASCSENRAGSSAVGPRGLLCPFLSGWEPLTRGRVHGCLPSCEMTSGFLILAPGAPQRFFRGFTICDAFYAQLSRFESAECCRAYFMYLFSVGFCFACC